MTDLPTYYLYESSDGWHKTDPELTKRLNSPIFNDAKLLAGRTFYPQWPEPQFKSETKPAWVMNPDAIKVVRCEKIERTHDKTHARCDKISDRTCTCTVAKMLMWDAKKKMWVLAQRQP